MLLSAPKTALAALTLSLSSFSLASENSGAHLFPPAAPPDRPPVLLKDQFDQGGQVPEAKTERDNKLIYTAAGALAAAAAVGLGAIMSGRRRRYSPRAVISKLGEFVQELDYFNTLHGTLSGMSGLTNLLSSSVTSEQALNARWSRFLHGLGLSVRLNCAGVQAEAGCEILTMQARLIVANFEKLRAFLFSLPEGITRGRTAGSTFFRRFCVLLGEAVETGLIDSYDPTCAQEWSRDARRFSAAFRRLPMQSYARRFHIFAQTAEEGRAALTTLKEVETNIRNYAPASGCFLLSAERYAEAERCIVSFTAAPQLSDASTLLAEMLLGDMLCALGRHESTVFSTSSAHDPACNDEEGGLAVEELESRPIDQIDIPAACGRLRELRRSLQTRCVRPINTTDGSVSFRSRGRS